MSRVDKSGTIKSDDIIRKHNLFTFLILNERWEGIKIITEELEKGVFELCVKQFFYAEDMVEKYSNIY